MTDSSNNCDEDWTESDGGNLSEEKSEGAIEEEEDQWEDDEEGSECLDVVKESLPCSDIGEEPKTCELVATEAIDDPGNWEITVSYHSEKEVSSEVLTLQKSSKVKDVVTSIKNQRPSFAGHYMADVFVNEKQLILATRDCFENAYRTYFKGLKDHSPLKMMADTHNSESKSSSEEEKPEKKRKKGSKPNAKSKGKSSKRAHKDKLSKKESPEIEEAPINYPIMFEKEEFLYIKEDSTIVLDDSFAVDVLLEDTYTFSMVQTYKLKIREAILPSCHYFSSSESVSLKAVGIMPFTTDIDMTIKVTDTGTSAFSYCRAKLEAAEQGIPVMIYLENTLLIGKGHSVAVSLVDPETAKGRLCATRQENTGCIGTDGTQFSFLSASKLPVCALYYQGHQ